MDKQDDLDVEHSELTAEHAALEQEHRTLEGRPYDVDVHVEHSRRLHQHIERLHRYMAARGLQVPRRRGQV